MLIAQTVLAQRWKWSRKKVYAFLKHLEDHKHAIVSTHRLFTMIFFPFLGDLGGQKNAHLTRTERAPLEAPICHENQVVTDAPAHLREIDGQKNAHKTRTIEDRIYNTNTHSGEGCGENQNSSLPLVEHPPLSFSEDDFPDFEELAPKTAVIDEFPDSEPPKTPPEPSTEKPVEWPDNPTEGALFKKKMPPRNLKNLRKPPKNPRKLRLK